MAPTNSTPPGWAYQPWSYTGHKSQFADKDVPQPDNAGWYKIKLSSNKLNICKYYLNNYHKIILLYYQYQIKYSLMSYKMFLTEFDINGSVEACMGLLNDIYEAGVKWHDIACYHTKVRALHIYI